MQAPRIRTQIMLALVLALGAGPLLAAPPAWAGKDKGGPPESARGGSSEASVEISLGRYFDDRTRQTVRSHFAEQARGGHCPPGLAKKNNGCMPPGQAKKWRMGHPLPDDVGYYDLSPRIRAELGDPPPGYKFVRVAGDILMIAIGTSMVADAIEDLGRL